MLKVEQGDTIFFKEIPYVAVYDNSSECCRCAFDGIVNCPNSLTNDFNVKCLKSKIIFKKVLTKLSK